ncbi:hypothetical protein [Salinisphaera orenii]|uniref:Uncharacterized protein n=1 Tax=Salinisphaera orenii YIM 95161 TaxID=1051139 RepID=A0A423PIV6_9GAMM|nr:hypothetical protein [Salinisphaera halophila]ROO25519.1 hypothetical protein SAHL_14325 [Salinisphaera halophila YIM 95161]
MTRDEIDDELTTAVSRAQLLIGDVNRQLMADEADQADIQARTLWLAELVNEIDVLREQIQEDAR